MIKENILITGGTGLIGSELIKSIDRESFNIRILSRRNIEIDGVEVYQWDIENSEIDSEALIDLHHIIHLAGANIGDGRWTDNKKQEIVDSRIKSAELIYKKLGESKLKTFISASATGIYGSRTIDKVFTEEDSGNGDFTSIVGEKWEASADLFSTKAERVVKVRTPVVLSEKGGIVKKLLPIVKLNFASPIGSGKQIMPWVHIQDLCDFYIKALSDKKIHGAYNLNSGNISNKEFMKTLAKVYNKLFIPIPVPSIFIKIAFGEMSKIVLEGSELSSMKVKNNGFEFKYKTLKDSLKDIKIKQNN
jgi:uncharacterized protein (TIGR01777 family)